MTDATLIADLIRSGVAPEMVQRVTAALVAAATGENHDTRSSSARRQAAYRERRRNKTITSVTGDSGITNHNESITKRNGCYAETPSSSSSPSRLPPTPPIFSPPLTPPTPSLAAGELGLDLPEANPPRPNGNHSKPPQPKKPSTADPRHAEFVAAYCREWGEAHGEKYVCQPRDFASLEKLLKACDKPTSELMTIVRWCWELTASDKFAPGAVRATATLHGFCQSFSAICAFAANYDQTNRRN